VRFRDSRLWLLHLDPLYIGFIPIHMAMHVALEDYVGRSDTPEQHYSRASMIVDILRRDNPSRATVLHRHSRILSVSHVEFDVGNILRAPDGLGSAKHAKTRPIP